MQHRVKGVGRLVPYPLDVVYAQAGIAPPRARAIAPARIPPPYRSLLVHENDMTLTLEAHFGGRVTLRALSTFRERRSYYRRVLLVQEYSARPVEMGAIRIDLDGVPAAESARGSSRTACRSAGCCATAESTSAAGRRCSWRSHPTPR